jgi:hypothetical protein
VNNDLFINVVHVLGQNWGLVVCLLLFVFWGTLLVFVLLKKTTDQQFTDIELTALALGGWPLPVLFVSLLILLLRIFLPDIFVAVITLTIICGSAGYSIYLVWKRISASFLIPISVFLLFVFLRLGFAAEAILPPYFDSAEHYRIIQQILDMPGKASFAWPTTSYYHLGYHLILAAITLIIHADIGQTMLLFGQIILAALPLPIWFLIYRVTQSKTAAVFGVVLAAFGWFMPSHAVNWGKYPALLGLLLIQFTLGAAVLQNRWLFALVAIVSVLIHTRAAILFGIFGAAWMFSAMWLDQPRTRRTVIFTFVLVLFGALTLLIGRNQIVGPILEPYRIWVTLLAGLLAVAVYQSFPRLTFFTILVMLFMLAGIFIPIRSNLSLLDRPLVEMALFFPLTFLGGLGVMRIPKLAVIVFALLIVIHAGLTYDFSPSDCCQLVTRDDATALDWMDRHLPKDAYVAIAGANLNLDAFGRPMRSAGVDAGIWVLPLTGRASLPLPYSIDFSAQNTRDLLCSYGVTHIYVGSMQQSFNPDFAKAKPEWYKTIFTLPEADIVQVINCGG